MNKKQLSALAQKAAKSLKTEVDIDAFTKELRESFYEAALNAELDDHLGYERHHSRPGANSRNGSTRKTVSSDFGPLEINTPRDRLGEFSPEIIKKRQTRTCVRSSG